MVAKGGCLLLNVGPDGEGNIDDIVYQRLEKVGEWLHKNGTAIYDTRTTPNYHFGNTGLQPIKTEKRYMQFTHSLKMKNSPHTSNGKAISPPVKSRCCKTESR